MTSLAQTNVSSQLQLFCCNSKFLGKVDPAWRKRCEFNPWVRKMLWRRAQQPTPVFLPRESHGQRSLAGYSPWGGKESDTTEVT